MKMPKEKGGSKPRQTKGGGAAARQHQFQMERGLVDAPLPKEPKSSEPKSPEPDHPQSGKSRKLKPKK